jgi:hypothetical protein
MTDLAWLTPTWGDDPPGTSLLSTWRRHDGVVPPWKRRLSDDERSVLPSELLLRHPELVAEAEEITSTLLVVEDDQELAGEITARLRALRPSGPVSVGAGRGRVLQVLQPYIDDLSWRKERGARRATAEIAIAILLVGNLIAAPLFRPARRNGAIVFLDLETLEPHKDHWASLSTLGRMTPQELRRAATLPNWWWRSSMAITR